MPTVQNGGDTPLLGQDQGFREILRYFLDKYPDSAFQAVNGGGNDAGRLVALAQQQQSGSSPERERRVPSALLAPSGGAGNYEQPEGHHERECAGYEAMARSHHGNPFLSGQPAVPAPQF